MNRFDGQTALITGGARGLGFSIAEKLAGEGASVWILDREESRAQEAAEELRSNDFSARSIVADITDEDQVDNAFSTIRSEDQPCSIVVNSAGIVGPNGVNAEEVDLEDFEETCQINLTGSFVITKYALQDMLPQEYGRILLISSIAGKEGNAGMSPYSASKAGVIGFVKAAAKEHAQSGVTINSIAPATIRTEMVEDMDPEQVKYMTDKIPMDRCGKLEEVADLAAWIVSEEASFNTGFTFDLTGGRAVY